MIERRHHRFDVYGGLSGHQTELSSRHHLVFLHLLQGQRTPCWYISQKMPKWKRKNDQMIQEITFMVWFWRYILLQEFAWVQLAQAMSYPKWNIELSICQELPSYKARWSQGSLKSWLCTSVVWQRNQTKRMARGKRTWLKGVRVHKWWYQDWTWTRQQVWSLDTWVNVFCWKPLPVQVSRCGCSWLQKRGRRHRKSWRF